ncbi:MAG: hypothetical protein NTY35_12690 [Planctomycetota bacterium]|nr:hypothetical protein [Planctomycetota bacterium]
MSGPIAPMLSAILLCAASNAVLSESSSRALLAAMEQPTPPVQAPKNASPYVWTKLTTERYPGKQDDVAFVDARTGWYANGAGRIFRTTDGGTTWTQQVHMEGTYFRCLAFVDAQRGFAGNIGLDYFPNVTDATPLYATTDGGATWKPVAIEGAPIVGLCALEIVRTPFVNAGNLDEKVRLVGGGRVGGPAVFVHSEDLGATWKQAPLPETCAMVLDVHFLDQKVGFLAAATDPNVAKSHAAIFRTEDGGATWKKVYESPRRFELTWKIAFPTDDVGYVTIQNYDPDLDVKDRFVAKTTDGGKTWAEIPLVVDHAVREFGIAFLDEKTGWVGAMPGGFETRDGGATWQRADFGNAVNKIRVVREGKRASVFALGVEMHRLEVAREGQ